MLSAGGGGRYGDNSAQLAPEVALSNKFPGKLWRLVNSCKTGAIQWGKTGLTIIVHQTEFQREFLDPPNTMFKTTNIGSFIRQLNLYGFRKLNVVRFAEAAPDSREIHEFQNDFFHRGRPDLLSYLKRNVGIRRTRDIAVKRKIEHIDSRVLPAAKFPRFPAQDLGYSPMLHRHHNTTVASAAFAASDSQLMYQNTATGKWPIYMHWDETRGVCKYVVLPDTGTNSLPSSINGNPVVYSPVQGPDGRYYPVVKLPGKKEEDPPQEYYLVKILPEAFQKNDFPKEIIPCFPAAPGEYTKILGGGDASWSYRSETGAVPKHNIKQEELEGCACLGVQAQAAAAAHGDSYPLPAFPEASTAPHAPGPHPHARSYSHYAHSYTKEETDSEFSSDSEDVDVTDCNTAHPSLGTFEGEPRVICEGGRTVGLNELVQMAARVLTQAQTQDVINTARQHLQQQGRDREGATTSQQGAVIDLTSEKEVPSSPLITLTADDLFGADTPPSPMAFSDDSTTSPWSPLRGGATVLENERVKVEMMETCQNLGSLNLPGVLEEVHDVNIV